MENKQQRKGKKDPVPPQSPHDKFFKAVFKRTHFVKALFRAKLPKELLEKLFWCPQDVEKRF